MSLILESQWEKPEGFQGQSESLATDQMEVHILYFIQCIITTVKDVQIYLEMNLFIAYDFTSNVLKLYAIHK